MLPTSESSCITRGFYAAPSDPCVPDGTRHPRTARIVRWRWRSKFPMARTLTPHPQTASRLALSELAPGAMQSEIRAMSTECDRIGGINLAQGICDTPVPMPVETAAIAAIVAGHNIYTRLDGIARLRTAIADKQQRE